MAQMPAVVGPDAAFWEDIDEQVLGAPAASISFAGLDTSFTLFRLTAYVIKDGTRSLIFLRLNADVGANYDHQHINGEAAVLAGSRTVAGNRWDAGGHNNLAANQEMNFVYTIAKPSAGEVAQGVWGIGIIDLAGLEVEFSGGQWNNIAALISQIDVLTLAGNLDTGTRVLLEGGKPV